MTSEHNAEESRAVDTLLRALLPPESLAGLSRLAQIEEATSIVASLRTDQSHFRRALTKLGRRACPDVLDQLTANDSSYEEEELSSIAAMDLAEAALREFDSIESIYKKGQSENERAHQQIAALRERNTEIEAALDRRYGEDWAAMVGVREAAKDKAAVTPTTPQKEPRSTTTHNDHTPSASPRKPGWSSDDIDASFVSATGDSSFLPSSPQKPATSSASALGDAGDADASRADILKQVRALQAGWQRTVAALDKAERDREYALKRAEHAQADLADLRAAVRKVQV